MAGKFYEKDKPKNNFYNFDKVNSYNGIFNFVISMRGLGKTYGAKKQAIRRALKHGEEFVYVRRYKDELKMSRDAFFSDLIVEDEFPDWDFRAIGSIAQAAPASTRDDKKRPWKLIGHFIPLSIAQSVKSVSYPRVTTIIYDEFIIEKGNTPYLSNEPIKFQQLYSTIARKRENVRVYFLANAVTIMNPYFLHYKIRPDELPEFSIHSDGFIIVHLAESPEFAEEVNQTRFGKFISGTEYGDYAVGNKFSDNHKNLVDIKTPAAVYFLTLETASGIFSIWVDYTTHLYYVQQKRPRRETIATLVPENVNDDRTLLTFTDKVMQNLRTAFRHGKVYFDTPLSRNAFIEVFKR